MNNWCIDTLEKCCVISYRGKGPKIFHSHVYSQQMKNSYLTPMCTGREKGTKSEAMKVLRQNRHHQYSCLLMGIII